MLHCTDKKLTLGGKKLLMIHSFHISLAFAIISCLSLQTGYSLSEDQKSDKRKQFFSFLSHYSYITT